MKYSITQKALTYFMQYGFKSFTMDDLANSLGISKKTLYEQFSSKNELVEATLDYALEMTCHQVDKFISGKGSVIENVFRNQKEVQNLFNLSSSKPIWELKKYFPKTYDRMNIEFTKSDACFIDKLLEKGWEEGLFRKDINISFFKVFYSSVQRLRTFSDTFDEREFPFWDTIYTIMEYFFRIIVNEKGLQELEKNTQKNKGTVISN
jgi:transcriptional regulator, TetR family